MFQCRIRSKDSIAKIALDVSNPHSPHYGHYLTSKQVSDLTAPAKEDIDTVMQWLHSNAPGATINLKNRGTITVDISVNEAEGLLHTRYRPLQNLSSGKVILRASNYEMPVSVSRAIDALFGPHDLPLPVMRPHPRFRTQMDRAILPPLH